MERDAPDVTRRLDGVRERTDDILAVREGLCVLQVLGEGLSGDSHD